MNIPEEVSRVTALGEADAAKIKAKIDADIARAEADELAARNWALEHKFALIAILAVGIVLGVASTHLL